MVEEHKGCIRKQHANVHAVYLHISLWHAFKTHFFFINKTGSEHGTVKREEQEERNAEWFERTSNGLCFFPVLGKQESQRLL